MKKLILILVLLISCSNVNKDKATEFKLPPYKPNVVVTSHRDSIIVFVDYISFQKKKNPKSDFINSINTVEIRIMLGQKVIRNISTKPALINKPFDDSLNVTALYSSGKFVIENSNLRREKLTVEIVLVTSSSFFSYKKSIDDCRKDLFIDNFNIMELLPFVERIDTSHAAIGLFCKRLNNMKDEYLPSSEDIRAELYAAKGSVLWSSNHDMNYTMQIGKVLPDSLNGVNLYLLEWNYKNNAGKKIVPGDYRLRLTIPSKPISYFVLSDIKLNINDDK